jgi:hypothetical protein
VSSLNEAVPVEPFGVLEDNSSVKNQVQPRTAPKPSPKSWKDSGSPSWCAELELMSIPPGVSLP